MFFGSDNDFRPDELDSDPMFGTIGNMTLLQPPNFASRFVPNVRPGHSACLPPMGVFSKRNEGE